MAYGIPFGSYPSRPERGRIPKRPFRVDSTRLGNAIPCGFGTLRKASRIGIPRKPCLGCGTDIDPVGETVWEYEGPCNERMKRDETIAFPTIMVRRDPQFFLRADAVSVRSSFPILGFGANSDHGLGAVCGEP